MNFGKNENTERLQLRLKDSVIYVLNGTLRVEMINVSMTIATFRMGS